MKATTAVPLLAAAMMTVGLPGVSHARSCDACGLQLTARTGPYRVAAAKEASASPTSAPRIRVTITNPGPHAVVVGGTGAASRIVLNSVTPNARGIQPIAAVPAGQTKSIPAGSSWTFHVVYPYRLVRPGAYRFNVSYGAVDSNIVTYTVR